MIIYFSFKVKFSDLEILPHHTVSFVLFFLLVFVIHSQASAIKRISELEKGNNMKTTYINKYSLLSLKVMKLFLYARNTMYFDCLITENVALKETATMNRKQVTATNKRIKEEVLPAVSGWSPFVFTVSSFKKCKSHYDTNDQKIQIIKIQIIQNYK